MARLPALQNQRTRHEDWRRMHRGAGLQSAASRISAYDSRHFVESHNAPFTNAIGRCANAFHVVQANPNFHRAAKRVG